MLKKLMWILPLALFMYGCSGDGEDSGEMVEQNAQPTTIVRGDVRGADNQMAYLMAFEGGEQVMVDSGMIMNGVFELETKTNQLREYILIIGESDMPVIFFSDESDTEITVSGEDNGGEGIYSRHYFNGNIKITNSSFWRQHGYPLLVINLTVFYELTFITIFIATSFHIVMVNF